MDGVFMKKIINRIVILALIVSTVFAISLIKDRRTLKNELIRLHIVGASNGEHDQNVKLSVRDAVVDSLSEALSNVTDVEQARQYIRTHLPKIQAVANDTLCRLGVDQQAVVTFLEEEFPTRQYDTFALPSGIYQALRITIGEGRGRNWWCVVFPSMCYGASSADVEGVAAGAGFSPALTDSITGKQGYQIRFFILDVIGQIENFFHMN